MENYIIGLLPALAVLGLLRFALRSVKGLWKLVSQAVCGLLCLLLLNTSAPVTGLRLPINAVTVLLSGTLGLPGVGLVALLELL